MTSWVLAAHSEDCSSAPTRSGQSVPLIATCTPVPGDPGHCFLGMRAPWSHHSFWNIVWYPSLWEETVKGRRLSYLKRTENVFYKRTVTWFYWRWYWVDSERWHSSGNLLSMYGSLDSEKKLSLLSEEQQAASALVETIRQSIQQNDVLKPINLLSQQMKPDTKRQR